VSKPRVFIGSSTSALEVARNVQAHLESVANVTIWRDLSGAHTMGKTIIEAILDIIEQYDFAVMIFAVDDQINRSNDTVFVPRDNVVFELGLFMAKLGRDRTFVLKEMGVDIHVATDLSGLVTANYDGRNTNNLRAILSTPCVQIRETINALGIKPQDNIENAPLVQQAQALMTVRSLSGVVGVRHGISSEVLSPLVTSSKRIRILQTWTPDIVRGLEKELLHCVTANEGTIEVLLIAPGVIATQRRVDQEEDLNLDDLPHNKRESRLDDLAKDSKDEIRATVKALFRVQERCGENAKMRTQVRLYSQLPSIAFYMCDQQAFLGFFQKGGRASRGIFLHIEGDNNLVWKAMEREFDRLWAQAQSPSNFRLP